MKRQFFVLVSVTVLTLFSASCSLFYHLFVKPNIHVESCRFSNGTAAGGYAVEIQGIPNIEKLDVNKAVTISSRRIEEPKPYDYKWPPGKYPSNYSHVNIFYDSVNSVWFNRAKLSHPRSTPPTPLKVIRNAWDTRVSRFEVKLKPSQKSLIFWVDSRENTCASLHEESISSFRKRISFLSFRLYYDGKIYDASHLLHFENSEMFIAKPPGVKVESPAPAEKANFYPPFFVKKPHYILSPGRHVIQFSSLRPVSPEEVLPPR